MFRKRDRADQFAIDKTSHDIELGLIDGVVRRRASRHDQMIERADFVEQPGNLCLLGHVGSNARDTMACYR
jgi:hypothetical protein